MTYADEDTDESRCGTDAFARPGRQLEYVKVGEMRPADDKNTCLRPLGLCELGGSCDSCWYRPDHPRFRT